MLSPLILSRKRALGYVLSLLAESKRVLTYCCTVIILSCAKRENIRENGKKNKKGLQVLMAELIMNIPSNTLALLKKKCILLL